MLPGTIHFRLVKNLLPNSRVVRVHLDDFVAYINGFDKAFCLKVVERQLEASSGTCFTIMLPGGLVIIRCVTVRRLFFHNKTELFVCLCARLVVGKHLVAKLLGNVIFALLDVMLHEHQVAFLNLITELGIIR